VTHTVRHAACALPCTIYTCAVDCVHTYTTPVSCPHADVALYLLWLSSLWLSFYGHPCNTHVWLYLLWGLHDDIALLGRHLCAELGVPRAWSLGLGFGIEVALRIRVKG
jgi:hypothetical protein